MKNITLTLTPEEFNALRWALDIASARASAECDKAHDTNDTSAEVVATQNVWRDRCLNLLTLDWFCHNRAALIATAQRAAN